MGFKEGGLRGSLRNVSVGVGIPDSVIDNFEEVLYEDQNKTLSDRYGGDTGLFARQQTTVQEGSYALEGTITDFEIDRVISSTSIGTVEQGDSFAVDLQWPAFDSDRGMIFRFGTADETNTPQSYGVGAYGANDWSLSYWDGSNNRTDLDTSSTDDPSNYIGEWVTAKVTWGTDDSIAVDFEDNNGSSIESLSASDASVTSGGIGFMASVFEPNISETYYFDNVRFI